MQGNDDFSLCHILIIDHEIHGRNALMNILREENARISHAFDGLQGYERAVANRPDLILSNIQLPKLNGVSLCRRLKVNPFTNDIPLLFYGQYEDPENRLEAFRSGAVDFIPNDCSDFEVVARIRVHLSLARKKRMVQTMAMGANQDLESFPSLALVKPAASSESLDDVLVVSIVQKYVMQHLNEPLSITHLADVAGVHEKRLTKAFQDNLNISVFEFVRDTRMHEAKRLLLETSLRTMTIAAEIGYSSSANFSTAFQQFYGVSPSVFRKLKGNIEPSEEMAKSLAG